MTITVYIVVCAAEAEPPHCFEILKTVADTILGGAQGYLDCPICHTRNFGTPPNTIVSTT